MTIAVKATQQQKEEWLTKTTSPEANIIWVENKIPEADAYFDLTFEEYGPAFKSISQPIFINSVTKTTDELPVNAIRINAWNGFLKRDIIEVAASSTEAKQQAAIILEKLGRKYQMVPDVPGMIAARAISMIINEAYFALGDDVSTKAEIDVAMKLGTNYPLGPFEWSEKIGLHNIYRLLKKLSETDKRYEVAPALEQELKSIA
jgi:3-hydroxybutyryl-CoA dehydrogenase